MKKIITAVSVFVLISCLAVVLYGCGAEDETITTNPEVTITTTREATNEGMVTDESERDDNGVIGDAITDVSEGISDIVTDISEDMTKNK